MEIFSIIAENGNCVTRKDLTQILGTEVGAELYNLGFNALGDVHVGKQEVLVQRTAKTELAEKVVIDFNALLGYLGKIIVAPQGGYTQSLKSHALWGARKDYILTRLSKYHLTQAREHLIMAIQEAQENEE